MDVITASADLANACDSLADQIGAMRRAAGWVETPGQTATLNNETGNLRISAANARTAGVAAALASAAPSLTQINDAATQASAAVAKLKTFDQVVTLVGSLLSLAASAASGNFMGIANGAAAVISEVAAL